MTTENTARLVPHKLRVAAAATLLRYQRLAEIAAHPDFVGWDELDEKAIMSDLVQLFPASHLVHKGKPGAAPVARLFTGRWTEELDGTWSCECSGDLAGLRVIMHYVNEPVKPRRECNYVDLTEGQ